MSFDVTDFVVGAFGMVMCSSDDGVADRIEITSSVKQLMVSEMFVPTATLIINLVTDSLHNSDITCTVTRDMGMANETVSNQTITITVEGMWHNLTSMITTPVFHTHTVPSDAISAQVNRTGRPVAGSQVSLTCIVEAVPGFANMPTALWRHEDGDVVVSGGDFTIQTAPGNRMSVTTLTFYPLRATHGGRYMCSGSLITPSQPNRPLQAITMEDLRIQSKCHHNYVDKTSMMCM